MNHWSETGLRGKERNPNLIGSCNCLGIEGVGGHATSAVKLAIDAVALDRAEVTGPDRQIVPVCPTATFQNAHVDLHPGTDRRRRVPGRDNRRDWLLSRVNRRNQRAIVEATTVVVGHPTIVAARSHRVRTSAQTGLGAIAGRAAVDIAGITGEMGMWLKLHPHTKGSRVSRDAIARPGLEVLEGVQCPKFVILLLGIAGRGV